MHTGTTANAFYEVQDMILTGEEREGATAFSTAGGARFFAYNIGSQIPTGGTTKVEVTFVPHRWIFDYNGKA